MVQKPKFVVMVAESHRTNRSKLFIAGGVVLLAAGAAGLWYWAPWHKEQPVVTPRVSDKTISQQTGNVSTTLLKGDSTAAIKQAQGYLGQDLSDAQRVALLEQEASAYIQQGNQAKALELYKQSEALQKQGLDMATAQGLMYINAERGDKHQAAAYARKLIAAAEASPDPVARASIPSYKEYIRSLGEQP